MLPPSHVAFTWLVLSLSQERFKIAPKTDYRLIALAAMGPDLIDKPLAWAYFYRRYQSAVLLAHTLLAHIGVVILTATSLRRYWIYALGFVGHLFLDRLWYYPNTFYWPFRGWRFHIWRRQGSEQQSLGLAYLVAFTQRPGLWIWEVGGFLALAWFVWRHRLYRPRLLFTFLKSGHPPAP